MLTAQSLRKMTKRFKDPDSHEGILAAMTSHAESGMGNISFRYKDTKKNRDLIDFAIKDLTKRGFRVFYNNNDSSLSLEIEW